MGLVYVTVGSVANIMFKNMGMPNDQAAFWSSLLGLPYTLKPLWAPLLELYRDEEVLRRADAVPPRGVIAARRAVACSCPACRSSVPVLALLALAAFAGATQDIGTDGVYVTTLDVEGPGPLHGLPEHVLEPGPHPRDGLLVRVQRHVARRAPGAGRRPG